MLDQIASAVESEVFPENGDNPSGVNAETETDKTEEISEDVIDEDIGILTQKDVEKDPKDEEIKVLLNCSYFKHEFHIKRTYFAA